VTERDVAAEIRQLARDELRLAWEGDDAEPLAGRLDSLALLSLVVAVEDRFRVRITEADAAGAQSLADLARLVIRLRAAAPSDGPEARP